jgi:CheY-like chemotaxis protein
MESNQTHRILIADDNQANCELLEAYLANFDCETEIATDGQEAYDKAVSFKPDLILLDVMMPKLSGFEVCQKIKSDPALSKIMILMVTALNELGDIERAVDAGTKTSDFDSTFSKWKSNSVGCDHFCDSRSYTWSALDCSE